MPFLTFGSVDIRFAEKELVWRIYTAPEALPTTNWAEHAKEFAAAALGTMMKPLWPGLESQECPLHDPCRVFRLHRCLPFGLRDGATRVHRHQQSSY